MGKISDLMKPRIFISHAWEDKAQVRLLESELKAVGAEVWVDHVGVRGGDNLPKQINDALDWCNTLLLVWSKAAKASHWVELEWTNAISLQKRIIPCLHDDTPLPSILANKVYVNFANEANGLRELLATLQLEPLSREAGETVASPASASQTSVIQTPPISQPRKPALIQLRSTPSDRLSGDAVRKMVRAKNYYNRLCNPRGKGIAHQYQNVEWQGVKFVVDHVTGLTWQQSGSESRMFFNGAMSYVQQLNAKNYGGYNDWRLPTLEEAMSLVEHKKNYEGLYIDPIFDCVQVLIWTADKRENDRYWYVFFAVGDYNDLGDVDLYVRVVRS